jgi:DNA-binding NarL/FixJ family response regulator
MPPTLLLIDDHALIRQGLREWLKFEFPECQVIEAASGEEGIALVQNHVLHLVLMDVNLPGMDGFQATARLKKIAPALPVVIVTFNNETIYRNSATIAGADAFIPKNKLSSELQPIIARLLPTTSQAMGSWPDY